MAKLDQSRSGDVLILRPVGMLDQAGVEEVGALFSDAAASAGRVVVDLSSLDLMNTPGIAMILGAHRSLQHSGGRLVVTGAQGIVEDLLRRCRLDAVLTMAPSMGEAVEWARGG